MTIIININICVLFSKEIVVFFVILWWVLHFLTILWWNLDFFPMILCGNLCFFCDLLTKLMLRPWSFDKMYVLFHNPLLKHAFFPWSFYKSCISSAILCQNLFSHDLMMKLPFSPQSSDETCIFMQSFDEIQAFPTILSQN